MCIYEAEPHKRVKSKGHGHGQEEYCFNHSNYIMVIKYCLLLFQAIFSLLSGS